MGQSESMKYVSKVMYGTNFLLLYNFSFGSTMGRTFLIAKCPWGELSMGQNGYGAKCHRASLNAASFEWARCLWVALFMGRVSMGLVVRDPKKAFNI
jgi:hypothetical protein